MPVIIVFTVNQQNNSISIFYSRLSTFCFVRRNCRTIHWNYSAGPIWI